MASALTSARAEFVRGTINGWANTHPMVLDATFGNIYAVTIQAFTNEATAQFKFDRYGTWTGEQWGAAGSYTTAVKNSSIGNARYTNNTAQISNLTYGTQTATNRYTFRLAGPSTDWFRDYVVMETDGNPVSISNVFDNSASASTGAVAVSIQSSAAPSAQESLWVRYSTNLSFSPGVLAPASGSGTNFGATLPAQAAGTRVYYYVLTSTMPSNVIASNVDLCTLRGKTAGATNYSYRAGTMNAFHFPTNAEPSGAFMRNPPTTGVNPGTSVFFYVGNQFAGGGNTSDMTGMLLVHRLAGGGSWATNGGAFDSTDGNNKYWVAALTGNTYAATNEVEYYFRATANDHNTTWIGTTNSGVGNVRFLAEAGAQAAPFRFTYGGFVANLGNSWHIPSNSEPPGVTMRNPLNNPATNQAVFIYNGTQFQGGPEAGDQSGGYVVYRRVGDSAWSSNAMVFNAESGEVGNNKYWRGAIPANAFGPTNEVEYYLWIDYTDRDNTYLGTTNGGASVRFATDAEAKTNTFKYRYDAAPGLAAAFLWHNDNRVVLGASNVQFWVKIGYAEGTGTNRFVDFAHVYLTTNGASPHGSFGASTNAAVIPMQFSHMEEDSYEGGDAMWWVGYATNLPQFTLLRYRIGAYKATNSVERFADFGTSGTNDNVFAFSLGTSGAQALAVDGQNADYTTSKFFVDEIAGDTFDLVVRYTPGVAVTNVEVFSNLDRRDYADVDYTNAWIAGDGYPDGIRPPDGNLLTIADTGAYFRAWTMLDAGGGQYVWTGRVSKTGAYRLTARYQVAGNTNYFWYSSDGRRDHAIVVSPKKALDMTLYELNTLTTEATAPSFAGRSTFRDLLGIGNPGGDDDSFDPFNLEYLNFIQANCLWFQPIHPNGFERGENDPLTGSPYAPGSPYATKDYWAVMPVMGAGNSEASALSEFTNYVAQCDAYTGSVGSIHIMLDGVFNHTSWDAVMGQGGVDLGFSPTPTNKIGHLRPQWYSLMTDYGQPATSYTSAYLNDFATAPDRGDFGKWNDVTELYFGKYSALVRNNPEKNGDYLNEDDVYDFAGMTTDIKDLWRYFAYYPEYWIKKTGHSGTNTWNAAQDDKGIDALRCDFGQGLPPQIWEYIINRTRAKKWNFVFMAETLDGGKPGYRSNRHFDILNESLVFQFTQSKINDSSALSYAFYLRNLAYNNGAILLNVTSHDEVMPDNDPWVTAARYGAISSMAGLPMIFYGQEQGIGLHDAFNPNAALDGFADHELNFGKYVPHFKRWNQLQVWTNPPPNSDGLDQWYGRVNWARLNSPALRSRNHRVLATMAGPEDARIFAVAKWETAGAGPATSDVVLAFTRFIEHGLNHTNAANVFNLQPVWNELGLETNKLYTVRNLAASDAFFEFTNGWPRTGLDLYTNGIYVELKVDVGQPITNDGAVVQYLKLVELDAPNQPPVISLPGPHILAVGSSTSFPVTVTDADGDPVTTNFVSAPSGATYSGGVFSWTALPVSVAGTTNLVVFSADDQQGEPNSVVTNTTTIVVPFDIDADGLPDGWEWTYFATLTNTPGGDADGDTVPNVDEWIAGTLPNSSSSFFRVQALAQSGGRTVAIPTVSGRLYRIHYADANYTNGVPWQPFANTNLGFGVWVETNTSGTRVFTDDEGTNSTLGPPAQGRRVYRVTVE
jgi:hypothetical protein